MILATNLPSVTDVTLPVAVSVTVNLYPFNRYPFGALVSSIEIVPKGRHGFSSS